MWDYRTVVSTEILGRQGVLLDYIKVFVTLNCAITDWNRRSESGEKRQYSVGENLVL